MKKLVLSFLVIALTGSVALAQKNIINPNVEKRTVSSFHGIEIATGIELTLTEGNAEEVVVSAATTEFRDKIITKVENGVLIIRFDDDKKFWKGWNGDKTKLKAYISVKKLDKLDVSGACDVFFEDGIFFQNWLLS